MFWQAGSGDFTRVLLAGAVVHYLTWERGTEMGLGFTLGLEFIADYRLLSRGQCFC